MKRILLLLLTFVLAFALFSCGDDEGNEAGGTGAVSTDSSDTQGAGDKDEEPTPSFEIVLDSSACLGMLNGKIEVTNIDTEYSLYYADEKGKLEGYTQIPVKDGAISSVVPPAATHIALITENEQILEKIPEECLLFGKEAFIFGALSDVHYNKYYSVEGQDDAFFAFDNALDYFDKAGVQMVAVTGDLSNDGEESALAYYNEAIAERAYPVYAVSGNHDINAVKNGLWKTYISDNVENCEFAPNGMDFLYKPQEAGGDVFVFFNLSKWTYSNRSETVVYNKQLNWLKQTLETYKDNQVYLFFHLFMCGPDGEKHTGVGNIMNPGGYTYPLPFNYSNFDERQFRRLMQEHKNVVYFSGHSHWMFEMEIYGEQANFSNFDGEYCYMVHVPSVTEPRWIGENDTDRTGKNGQSSQGWLIYDYGDTTILVPIDFITGTVYTEYMEIVK